MDIAGRAHQRSTYAMDIAQQDRPAIK